MFNYKSLKLFSTVCVYPINICMTDLTAFSHGQIVSKQWLCEKLEPILADGMRVAILGSWYNLTGFLLLVRNKKRLAKIDGYDTDSNALAIADKICNAYLSDFGGPVHHYNRDAAQIDLNDYNVVINTSCEHMDRSWYDNVRSSTIVCVQTSDMTPEIGRWDVSNPYPTMDSFQRSFPVSRLMFGGQKEIAYSEFSYRRFMVIGTK